MQLNCWLDTKIAPTQHIYSFNWFFADLNFLPTSSAVYRIYVHPNCILHSSYRWDRRNGRNYAHPGVIPLNYALFFWGMPALEIHRGMGKVAKLARYKEKFYTSRVCCTGECCSLSLSVARAGDLCLYILLVDLASIHKCSLPDSEWEWRVKEESLAVTALGS